MITKYKYLDVVAWIMFSFYSIPSHGQEKNLVKVPPEKNFVDESIVNSFPSTFAFGLLWPSIEEMRKREIEKGPFAEQSIRSTLLWVNKILKSNWIPDNLEAELHLLRPGKARAMEISHDAIYARYKIDKFVIQIVVNSESISFLVAEEENFEGSKNILGPKEAIVLIEKFISNFVNRSSEVLNGKSWTVTKHSSGYEGINLVRADDWVDGPRWWTDGAIVYLSFKKLDINRPTLPYLDANWFSREFKSRPRKLR